VSARTLQPTRCTATTARRRLSGAVCPWQPLRERSLEQFRRGTLDWIVATDVAARGLDSAHARTHARTQRSTWQRGATQRNTSHARACAVPEVELVVHTAVPDKSDSFVHRSGTLGRTAAAQPGFTFERAGWGGRGTDG
jgi:superfamily II DNA/RNA helicase